MKDPDGYSQDPSAIKYELCSEKKCATCYENRGCMYEQYFSAPTFNLVTLLLQNQAKTQTQARKKLAGTFLWQTASCPKVVTAIRPKRRDNQSKNSSLTVNKIVCLPGRQASIVSPFMRRPLSQKMAGIPGHKSSYFARVEQPR